MLLGRNVYPATNKQKTPVHVTRVSVVVVLVFVSPVLCFFFCSEQTYIAYSVSAVHMCGDGDGNRQIERQIFQQTDQRKKERWKQKQTLICFKRWRFPETAAAGKNLPHILLISDAWRSPHTHTHYNP